MNFTSLSEITTFGTPCNQNISFKNMPVISAALCVDFTGMKCAYFLNLSTTTMMESCCLCVLGKPVIKTRDIISHFHSGTCKGCSKLAGCLCYVLTCWHSKLLERYSTKSKFKPGQKICFLISVIIFW